jgi:signal transduction histidine kinase
VLAAPVAALVVVASFAVSDKVDAASEGSEVGRLAGATTLVTRLVDELQTERALTSGLITDPSATIQRTRFDLQTGLTDRASRELDEAVAADAEGNAAQFQDAVKEAIAPLSTLPSVRGDVLDGNPPENALIIYDTAVSDLLDANDQVVAITNDERLSRQVRAYVALSRYKELVSQETSLLFQIFTNETFTGSQYAEAASIAAAQAVLLQDFRNAATPEQVEFFDETTSGLAPAAVASTRTDALARPTASNLDIDPTFWLGVAQKNISLVREVENALAGEVTDAAAAQENESSREALLYGAGALAIVLFSLAFAVLVSRSIVGPLRRLTDAALEVRDELPRVVEQIKEPGDAAQHFEPITVESQDEVGRLAAAFNAVHDVAVEVASEQASLRASISDMVLNLARRNQSLLDRQLQYLDDLEDAETDPDSLQDLFTLDHLATRMRRNAESLLVLAGADPSRRRREPVAVADVVRAAGSEVEDYARIDIIANSPLAVSGSAAASVAHLLAELLENATAFSPPGTRVNVATEQAGEAVRVVISDSGLGMTEEELEEANDRLARPAMIDVALSKQLGFSVVARVADRFGIKVRLSSNPEGGVTATVVLPPSVLTAGADDLGAVANGAAPAAPAPAPAPEVGPSSMDDALPSAPASLEGLEELPSAPPEPAPAPEAPVAEAPVAEAPPAPPVAKAPAPAPAPQAPRAPKGPQAQPAARAPQPQRKPRQAPAPKPAASRPAPPAQPSGEPELTPAGLPRRARKAPLAGAEAAAARPAAPAKAAPKIERSPDQLRAMLSRFQQGTQSGRTTPAGSDTPFQPTEDAT